MSELAFSVTIADCEVQTFRSGGKGGQNQNKRDTGVRVIHHPSGARGEARDQRSQYANKKSAFSRMVYDDPKFMQWVKRQIAGQLKVEDEVARMMQRTQDIRTEVREQGKWVERDLTNDSA